MKKHLTISSSEATEVLSPHLVLTDGARCEVHTLKHSEIIRIGRSDKNDVVVNHEKASRRHCEIFYRGNRWFVRDLESKNGTRLNKFKVAGEEPLERGDVIEVGHTQVIFTGQEPESQSEFPLDADEVLSGDTDLYQNEEATDPALPVARRNAE